MINRSSSETRKLGDNPGLEEICVLVTRERKRDDREYSGERKHLRNLSKWCS